MKQLNIIDRVTGKDEWLTDPGIIHALGEFDLDPCSPISRPWPTAKQHLTILDNGLLHEWYGRVWMNPPYGAELIKWLNRLALHGNGIGLMFARLDTIAFHKYIFPFAESIFFFAGRLTFFHVDGTRAKSNGGAPSCLISFGEGNAEAIEQSGLKGAHLPVNRAHVILVGFGGTWRSVVKTAFIRLNSPSSLSKLYEIVQEMAPEKVAANIHYKAKIRQVVQLHFKRISKGIYAHD